MDRSELTEDIHRLLGELCRDWGFCTRLDADNLLSTGQLPAAEFADAVLTSEGMSPERETEWKRRIRDRFVERYGPSVST